MNDVPLSAFRLVMVMMIWNGMDGAARLLPLALVLVKSELHHVRSTYCRAVRASQSKKDRDGWLYKQFEL